MGKALSLSCKIRNSKKNGIGAVNMKSNKGSTKSAPSTPNSKSRVLKSAQKVLSPAVPVLHTPFHIVEFEIDGCSERVGVLEAIPVLDDDEVSKHLQASESNGLNFQTPSNKGSLRGKSKKIKSSKKSCDKNQRLTEQLSAADPSCSNTDSLSSANDLLSPPQRQPLPEADFQILEDYSPKDAPKKPKSYIKYVEKTVDEMTEEVEYDLDEVDCAWLEIINEKRRKEKAAQISMDTMEYLMDRLEKEAFVQLQTMGMQHSPLVDDDAECCVCLDGECQNSNVILFCDLCNLAIHQECYGVPYIPEGQWLCRRCLQSPGASVAGDCELCPIKGGALKLTSEGKWAHVVCAIWIPEVCFANTVFLEPIDGIMNVPPARWRLTCFICKQKGIGACIQCHKSNCYKAFHATCAQKANLAMTVDTVHHNSSVTVKKTAWCDIHAPPGSERKRKDGEEPSSHRQKLKETRKLLAENRETVPTLAIPNITARRVAVLALPLKLSGKNKMGFLKRLTAYWKLKRQSRNGVPLLRRLQISAIRPSTSERLEDQQQVERSQMSSTSNHATESRNLYRDWIRLRQDLEKVRLLTEMVRKREQQKLAIVRVKEKITAFTLRPFNMLLVGIVDEIMEADSEEIFAEPVDAKQVPTYFSVISHPMDLGTMRGKAENYGYSTIAALEKDFNLMISNCMKFNTKDTFYYKEAVKLRDAGKSIINQGRRDIEKIGFDPKTGLHLPR